MRFLLVPGLLLLLALAAIVPKACEYAGWAEIRFVNDTGATVVVHGLYGSEAHRLAPGKDASHRWLLLGSPQSGHETYRVLDAGGGVLGCLYVEISAGSQQVRVSAMSHCG